MPLGIDEGGTFTDFVFVPPEGGELKITKVSSDQAATLGVFLQGLNQMGLSLDAVDRITYGTTISTNAVLQRTGPDIGLLCTRGFRDVLDHQRWHQRVLYDLHQTRPAALVLRRYRCQITERTSAAGDVIAGPNESEIQEA